MLSPHNLFRHQTVTKDKDNRSQVEVPRESSFESEGGILPTVFHTCCVPQLTGKGCKDPCVDGEHCFSLNMAAMSGLGKQGHRPLPEFHHLRAAR